MIRCDGARQTEQQGSDVGNSCPQIQMKHHENDHGRGRGFKNE